MLETVTSVLSNTSYARPIAKGAGAVVSISPEASVPPTSPKAPYISLFIKVDTNFDRAVLQIRDNDTGDVVQQIPTETQLQAYRRAQTSNSIRESTAQEVATSLVPASASAAQEKDPSSVPSQKDTVAVTAPTQPSSPAPAAPTQQATLAPQVATASAPTTTTVDTSA